MNFRVYFSSRLTFLRKIAIYAILLLATSANAQYKLDPFSLIELKASCDIERKTLFDKKAISLQAHKNQASLETSVSFYENWLKSNNKLVQTDIYLPELGVQKIYFTAYDFFEPDFKFYLLDQENLKEINLDKGIHLKGIINNNLQSMVSVSLSKGIITGHIQVDGFNSFCITPGNSNKNKFFTNITKANLENEHEIIATCNTDDIRHFIEDKGLFTSRAKESCKRVAISIRADYDLYLKFNKNPQDVSNYILGMFNQINTIYRREDIQISISEIIIHTSPDGFPHTTATEELDHLRLKYKTYNGNISLCLSGATRNGKAALGGIAYINSLCQKNYSYAYVNVNGSYSGIPTFSFDVYSAAHEIGHVLGSRHTHACVWGPNKNQPIDNCAKVEGTCLAGQKPTKGTLMSYCYLAGQPGIDLSLGLGKEPGDLIRSKIAASACLNTYTPKTRSVLKANQHITANFECNDGIYSNYYYDNNTIDENDDVLIMSIQTNGQNIGSILDGTLKISEHTTEKYGAQKAAKITADYTDKQNEYFAIHKYWEVYSSKILSQPVRVKVFLNNLDFEEVQGSIPGYTKEQLKLFTIKSPGNPNPESNHALTSKNEYKEFKNSISLSQNTYILSSITQNESSAEFETIELSAVGFGAQKLSSGTQSETQFTSLKIRKTGSLQNVSWTTVSEKNSKYFIVLKSLNGIKFDSIGTVSASGQSSSNKNYSFNDSNSSPNEVYYRITSMHHDGFKSESPIASLSSSYSALNKLSLYPNPLGAGDLNVEFTINNPIIKTASFRILDPAFNQIENITISVNQGKNLIQLPSTKMKSGFYYIQMIHTTETVTQKIVVKKS